MSLSRLTKLSTILPLFVKSAMSVTIILKEIWILDAGNETHEKNNKNQEKIILVNLEYNTCLKLSNGSRDKSLPIIYWIPKLLKNPVGSRFVIASKNCSTKPLPKAVSNVFKLIYSQKKISIVNLNAFPITINSGYSKMLIVPLKILTSYIERRKLLNLLQHMTLVHCTPHFLMIIWFRGCAILLILFLKVEIKNTFVFPKIMLHTGGKSPKTT